MLAQLIGRFRGEGPGATLGRGAAGVLAARSLGLLLMFGVQVLLARIMGADNYGVYAYVLAWAGLMLLVGKMGMDTTIVRYAAAYNAAGEWGALRGILRRSDHIALLVSVGVAAVAAAVVWTLRGRMGPELAFTFWVALAVFPAMPLAALRQASLRGLGHPVAGNVIEWLMRPTILGLLAIASFLWISGELDGPAAMALNGVSYAAALLVGSRLLQRHTPRAVADAPSEYRSAEWLGMALPVLLLAGMSLVLYQTDVLMLGVAIGTREAGIYTVASRTASIIAFGLTASNEALGPMISALHSSGRREELQRLLTLTARAVLAFSLPAGLALMLAGRYVLGAFGSEFALGYWALVLLIAGQLVNALMGPVGLLLMMTGNQATAARVMTGCAILNVALNAALIPRFGLIGAAAATAGTMALWNALMLAVVLRRLGLNPTAVGSG